ncbi:hypothetical protein V1506DRAFT_508583 [Lipomyces tetrasporus]
MVAVFVGGTSGIGQGTLKQLAKYATAPKVYVVGRSKSSAAPLLRELEKTSEGIDTYSSVSYYARLRVVYDLLPLLSASVHPRVVAVLAGGKERAIDINNLELRNGYTAIKQFMGTFKGIWAVPATLATWTVIPALNMFGRTAEEAGEWCLFVATSARYPPAEPNDPEELGVVLPNGVPIAKLCLGWEM